MPERSSCRRRRKCRDRARVRKEIEQPPGHVIPAGRLTRDCSAPFARSPQATRDRGGELSRVTRNDELVDILSRQLRDRSDVGRHKRRSTRLRFEQGVGHPLPMAWKDGHVRRAIVLWQFAMGHSAGEHHMPRETTCGNLRFQ